MRGVLFVLLVECAREDGDAVISLLGCPHTVGEPGACSDLRGGSGHTLRSVGLVVSLLLGLLLALQVVVQKDIALRFLGLGDSVLGRLRKETVGLIRQLAFEMVKESG